MPVRQRQLQNPQFVFVDPKGRKHRENLLSPLPFFEGTHVDLNTLVSA